jgi:hypothetical protein
MLTRFLRLRAANRMLAFKFPSALKVFKNEAGGTHREWARERCVQFIELNRSVFV